MYVDENEEPLSEYEKQLMENRLELDALIKKELEKPEIVDCFNAINSYTVVKKTSSVKRRREVGDSPFKFSGMIPVERRTSSRLAKVTPTYNFDDAYQELEKVDEDIRGFLKRSFSLSGISANRQIKQRRSTGSFAPPVTMSVEDVSNYYLSKVCYKVSEKVYSQSGTSCHQCRQKTLDSKTVCRNKTCIGVRGQFCGVCLKNRYGEDAITVLKDPNWSCPPCRQICNCSICRARLGKRPTGILTPIVKRTGHVSVRDFLVSLKDTEDPNIFDEPSKKAPKRMLLKDALKELETTEDPLLGFDKLGRAVFKGLSSKNEYDLIGFQNDYPVYNMPNPYTKMFWLPNDIFLI